jgi:hypothetical protein
VQKHKRVQKSVFTNWDEKGSGRELGQSAASEEQGASTVGKRKRTARAISTKKLREESGTSENEREHTEDEETQRDNLFERYRQAFIHGVPHCLEIQSQSRIKIRTQEHGRKVE